MIYKHIEDIIGQTPLLQLDASHYGLHNTDIYVKLEYLNPFGSLKDRSVLGMVPAGQLEHIVSQGKELIESSSGNAAKTMQIMANKYDIPFTSVTNRIKIPEVERLLQYMGTRIVALPGRSECADPNDPDDAVGTIRRMMADDPAKYHHPSQYTNTANAAAHEATAAELYADLPRIDTFVTGVGTGGSSSGIIHYAQQHKKTTTWVGVVAEPSDFLPGIRTRKELFETELFHQEDFDELSEVTSMEALDALRLLVRHEGVLAGPTTGANFAAVLRYARQHDTLHHDNSRRAIAFLACDRLEPYLTYIEQRQPDLFGHTAPTDIYAPITRPNDSYNLPANRETLQWIDTRGVTVVDTRGVKPYARFHIAHSLNFPEEQLREVLAQGTPFAKDSKVLFVCPRGDRSILLAHILRGRGVEAYSLSGGLLAWRSHDLGFEKGSTHGA